MPRARKNDEDYLEGVSPELYALFGNDATPTGPTSLSLSELTDRVKQRLTSPILNNLWVRAEVSDFSFRKHCYITLIEKNSQGDNVAQMRATIWASTYAVLRLKFEKTTGRPLGNGLQVMLRGSVSYSPVYGISFNVTDIDPAYTIGDMERRRQEIILRLTTEGIIHRNKEHLLPPNPQRIAIVSAASAAGYKDFVHQLATNPYGIQFYTCLFPAAMQGQSTVESVSSALQRIERHAHLFDCVAIIRGGGSEIDLNWFDHYDLARAIALFPLPVITGIGHQHNVGVLDHVAAYPVKTPTAVADLLIDQCGSQIALLNDIADRTVRLARECIYAQHLRLNALLPTMQRTLLNRMATEQSRLNALLPTMQRTLLNRLAKEKSRLDTHQILLRQHTTTLIANENRRLTTIEEKVHLLSPQSVLQRGYSLTLKEGKVVTDAAQLKPGDTIVTQLLNSTITSTVNQ